MNGMPPIYAKPPDRPAIDLTELLQRAFMAGFKASGEGYNGEYPFDYEDSRIERELSEDAQAKVGEILSEVFISNET